MKKKRLYEEQIPKLKSFVESFDSFFKTYSQKFFTDIELYYGGPFITDLGTKLHLLIAYQTCNRYGEYLEGRFFTFTH